VYKKGGKYYNDHIKSCKGKTSIEIKKPKIAKTSTDTIEILTRLNNIENRLQSLERFYTNLKPTKSQIRSEDDLLEMINQKIHSLSKRMLGMDKVYLKDLFDELNKDNYITFDKFSEYLIRLNNLNRIQLESGMSSDEFSINDSYGNVFKLIRIIK
jgi:hypothetical protein